MSGVLHPVGPEPPSTYWLRRALVIGTLAVVVAVMTALLGGRNGPQQAVSAVPASTVPAVTPTSSPTEPISSATAATPTTSTSAVKRAPTTSAAPEKSALATKVPETTKAPAKKAPEKKAPEKKAPEKKAPKKKAPETKKAPPLCDPDVLRPTLTGQQMLKPKEDTTFTLSMINGGTTTCAVSVNGENFELKIYSGKDRIWSTGDCSTAVRPIVKDVRSQQAVEWKMTWNGRRSADGCKNRAEIPEPGTYVATATLEGTQPVRLRMTLTD